MPSKDKTPTELMEDDLDKAAGGDLEMNSWLEAAQAGMMDASASPRDAASGLPTGKRMHKPFSTLKTTSN